MKIILQVNLIKQKICVHINVKMVYSLFCLIKFFIDEFENIIEHKCHKCSEGVELFY